MKPERDLERLRSCLAQAVEVVGWPDDRLYLKDERVSAWSPAQHLDHLARALERVFRTLDVLLASEDPRIMNTGRPHFAARMLLLAGWIPRGRGEAPDEVLPEPRPVRHRVRELLKRLQQDAERFVGKTDALAATKGRIPHPLLGAFDASEWMRFCFVHTKHHLAIIGEIDQRRGAGVRADERTATDPGSREAPAQSP